MGFLSSRRCQFIPQSPPGLGSCQRQNIRKEPNPENVQMMKKKDFKRLSVQDQKAIKELIRDQPNTLLGKKREDQKGYADFPLWGTIEQTKLF
jgi:hypothetical protein